MRNSISLLILICTAIFFTGCPDPGSGSSGTDSFSFDEEDFDILVLDTCLGQGTTHYDFDNLVLPPDTRSIKVDKLDKWVFGDEYLDSLEQFEGTPEVFDATRTNSWGAPNTWAASDSGKSEETVRWVSGITDDKVCLVYYVDDADDPHNGKYHVYRYEPWQEDLSGLSLNLWFGSAHVFYRNLIEGDIAPGAPSLELFPLSGSTDGEIEEIRIEKTSFFKFRSLYGGDWSEDRGTTEEHMTTVLGQPEDEVQVSSMSEIDWNQRNVLFTYPLDATKNGGYIHYDLPADIKVRIFLGGYAGESLRILSMYFLRTPED